MKRATFTLAAVMLAGLAIAQDLPPGVLLLSRAKNHIKEESHRLPEITCLETVHREHQPPRGKMRPLDTICLEVLTNGEQELFASPGDRNFSEQHPLSYAGSGVLGTGIFGLYLKDILLNGNVSNEYKGEEEIGGRRLARYDYRLPLMWSGETLQTLEGSGKVGLRGAYWVDPQTYDVVRLELNADDIPPTLPITEAVTSINYARTLVGNSAAVLLPESAEFRIAKFSGEISHNRIEFTHCRVFGAESKISFSAPDFAEQTHRLGAAVVDDTLRPLPGGLKLAVNLRSRISGDMAVGALIDGVVAGNVPAKGAVLIEAGSPVRGRIRRLERYKDPFPYFVVALEFMEVESQRIRHRFYADLVTIEPEAGLEQKLSDPGKMEMWNLANGGWEVKQAIRETLVFSNPPGVVTFVFKGTKLDLPPGFRTVWKTRPLTR